VIARKRFPMQRLIADIEALYRQLLADKGIAR
jgi:hypothetical protein